MTEATTEAITEVIQDSAIVLPVEEVIETIETPPELPEMHYTYQPTDEAGRSIGGKQVIKYRTQEELLQEMTHQNTLLIRKLRAEARRNRLGISELEEIAPEAPRFTAATEFTPRELSNEERFQLSRDILDPEKSIEAQAALFEASVGVTPEVLRNTLKNVQQFTMETRARDEANAFVRANPDYVLCQENADAINQWLARYDLAPVQQNFQRAFETLRAQDPPIIITRNTPEPAVIPVQVPVVLPVIEPVPELSPGPTETIYEPARIPTGLSRDNANSTGTPPKPGSNITYTIVDAKGQPVRTLTGLAAVNAMPGDEYGNRLRRDPSFAKQVQKLEEEAAAARAPRR